MKTKRNNHYQVMVKKKHKLSEANEVLALEGGKFCLDVAKLVFAGIIKTKIIGRFVYGTCLFSASDYGYRSSVFYLDGKLLPSC